MPNRWRRRGLKRLPLLDGQPSVVREMVRRAADRAGSCGVTVADISAAIGLSPQAAEKHLNDLQRFGFVVCRGQMKDGQMQHVFVSTSPVSSSPAS